MIRVDQIKNANCILKQPSFKRGVQTNYGIKPPQKDFFENGLFAAFTSKIKDLFSGSQVKERAKSIEERLYADGRYLFNKVV